MHADRLSPASGMAVEGHVPIAARCFLADEHSGHQETDSKRYSPSVSSGHRQPFPSFDSRISHGSAAHWPPARRNQ
jgi:hypothetical protein